MPSTRAVPFICGRAHNDKENRMSATTIPHRRAAALLALSFIGCIVAAHAADAKPALAAKPTLSDVIKASAPSDWRPLDPSRTLYMELPAGRVVIELAPAFAPQTVANIETLAREHYFDGLAVIRSQDNYVAQWGDADEAHPKALGTAKEKVPAEFTVPMTAAQHFVRQRDVDGYAPQIGHADGMPAGRDPKTRTTWLAHCYGMVGVGRDSWTATSRWSAASSPAWTCCRRCRAAPGRWASMKSRSSTRRSRRCGWRPTCPRPSAASSK